MEHDCGRPRAGESSCDFRADVPGRSDAKNDNFHAGIDRLLDQFNGASKIFAQTFPEPFELKNFDIQDTCSLFKVVHSNYIMWAGVVTGKNLHVSPERKNMKTLIISILAALATSASAQTFRAPLGPQQPVRAMATPPPLLQRREVKGVVPQAFRGGNPFQMLNPWGSTRYGTWVEHTAFGSDNCATHRGKFPALSFTRCCAS